ncbi:hypothetical protein ACOSQ2_006810 [Xanthoceras sorbifolium]
MEISLETRSDESSFRDFQKSLELAPSILSRAAAPQGTSAAVETLREGLLLARNLGLVVKWVELDASNVVVAVVSVDCHKGAAGVIVNEVKALCREVGVFKCQAISRNWNVVAHTLASLTFFIF